VEPVFASVVAWLWLGQVLSGWQVVGGVVVLVGIGPAQTARQHVPTVLPEVPASLSA
jgi:drug/metabolite transporter (DMT)-like permease